MSGVGEPRSLPINRIRVCKSFLRLLHGSIIFLSVLCVLTYLSQKSREVGGSIFACPLEGVWGTEKLRNLPTDTQPY